MDIKKLSEPFSPDKIHWRVGATSGEKGIALAFLDARDVMERLDEVCGPENWQCDYPHANGKTCCRIGIKIGDEWVWKSNGAGDTDIEGEKGAFSGAFKRAAVLWGVGRYLYDLDSPWVAVEKKGRSTVIKASELPRLNALLTGERPPPPAEKKPAPEPDDWATFCQDKVGEMNAARTPEEIDALWADWQRPLEALQKDRPDYYDALVQRRQTIKQQKDKAA